ncbi:uncharacterized protein LOC101890845 isoform X2 [Musca domestica]|uniref:Uncharacterized protein LOC101890845 isoform X2 n=1 Tax=Musca domestica TaxID=7370 RepID=A0A1I8M3I8_MUSDO|nr:uncharacterized protein LOC101890845 isoform X2 [Musca domestica]XP_058981696.1 uncharacterized protein LOC101890845 isoform X2 [Musca domestica]
MNDISIILICLMSLPFILFIMRIAILTYKYFLMSRQLKAVEQQSARQNRQNAQSGYMNTNSTLNIHEETCCNAAPTKSPGDCPPAYDDIIPAAAGGAATSENGPNNTGIATITIENTGAVNASTNQAAGATAAATASGTPATTVIDIVANEKTNPNNAV